MTPRQSRECRGGPKPLPPIPHGYQILHSPAACTDRIVIPSPNRARSRRRTWRLRSKLVKFDSSMIQEHATGLQRLRSAALLERAVLPLDQLTPQPPGAASAACAVRGGDNDAVRAGRWAVENLRNREHPIREGSNASAPAVCGALGRS